MFLGYYDIFKYFNKINTMSKRWKLKDEIELMRQYAGGKTYEDISKNIDRSPNAIKLRLESIVYKNLVKDNPVSILVISEMLHTDADTIMQLYYSHKSFKQGKGEEVKDIVFEGVGNSNGTKDTNRTDILVSGMLGNNRNSGNGDLTRHRITGQKKINNNNLYGGAHISDTYMHNAKKNLLGIEKENRVLEEIIKNYRMKRQVKKLYVDGRLDKNSVVMYEKLLKRNND